MGTLQTLITEKPTLSTVASEQEQYKLQYGKYQQYKTDVAAKDVFVNEYSGPLGVGYVIYEYQPNGKELLCRATNVGPEPWQGHDWIPYKI